MSVIDINNHMCMSHSCGSVKFNLLKSNLIECANCGEVTDNAWYKITDSHNLKSENGDWPFTNGNGRICRVIHKDGDFVWIQYPDGNQEIGVACSLELLE